MERGVIIENFLCCEHFATLALTKILKRDCPEKVLNCCFVCFPHFVVDRFSKGKKEDEVREPATNLEAFL